MQNNTNIVSSTINIANNIVSVIENVFLKALIEVSGLDNPDVLLKPSTNPKFGDFQVNGVMAIAKQLNTNPRELAEKVLTLAHNPAFFVKLEVAGPGFINITLNNQFITEYVSNLNADNGYGVKLTNINQSTKIVVDLSSPNLAKEMHVGHLRSTVIGDCLALVLSYIGHNVVRQNHVGDWGTQFGMLIAFLSDLTDTESTSHNLTSQLSDLEEFYRKAKARFDADADFANRSREYVVILQNHTEYGELGEKVYSYWLKFREISLSHCQDVYKRLQVNLTADDVAGESLYNKYLPQVIHNLEQHNLITLSDGAKCVFLNSEDLEGGSETTPFIVQKQDGGYLYSTTDLAALNYRVHNLGVHRILYVVDARQSYHFKQLFAVSKKAGFAHLETKLEHPAFGTMMGEDGKPFKTRSGTTVKLMELIEEARARAYVMVSRRNPDWEEAQKQNLADSIAISALKYADLSKNRMSDYIFSFDKMLAFEGNTAPYLLYAYTRINSLIVRSGLSYDQILDQKMEISNRAEHKLLLHIAMFSIIITKVATECYPHYLCQYLYELSSYYMVFYENSPILNCDDDSIKNSRLHISLLSAKILQVGLSLLGIKTVDKM